MPGKKDIREARGGGGGDVDGGLRDRKRALRDRMRHIRSALPPAERGRRSISIERRLFELPEVRSARTVLAFHSFESEVSTTGILERALAQGKRVLLPAVGRDRMEAVDYSAETPLARASYGALEPVNNDPVDPAEVDLVIAPGLAFDRAGNRLGYGGGYFDGFLRRVHGGCSSVGVCFHEQLIDAVPCGPDDVPVLVVVTDAEVIRASEPLGRQRE